MGSFGLDHAGGGHPPPPPIPTAGIDLSLPATPESVATARNEVARLGHRLGLDERQIGDLKTITSEACMNAVLHGDGEGRDTYDVRATPTAGSITITVSDRGRGIDPRPASVVPGARLGLVLIAALASSVEIAERPGGGTRLRARLAR